MEVDVTPDILEGDLLILGSSNFVVADGIGDETLEGGSCTGAETREKEA